MPPKARQYILRLYPDRDAALIEALQAARESKRGGVQGLLHDALSAYLALTAKGLSPPVPAAAPDTGSVLAEAHRPGDGQGEDAAMHAAAEALHRRLSIPLPAAQALAKAPPLASALRLLRAALAFRPDYLTEIEAALLLEVAERLRSLVEEARKRRPALRSLEVES